jgi:hypothetical protein
MTRRATFINTGLTPEKLIKALNGDREIAPEVLAEQKKFIEKANKPVKLGKTWRKPK